MLIELGRSIEWLSDKFGSVEAIQPGIYAIPTETSRGPAFMKVRVNEDMKISDFTLWIDEKFTQSWYK
ncbi:hypothetical protein ABE425_04795 [Chryseobacterium cucumeris]|uniref:hypothetical protein n=1 Tax=Chryseobacterium cucumeris TaxID=1813611 RepID=UPI00320A54F0